MNEAEKKYIRNGYIDPARIRRYPATLCIVVVVLMETFARSGGGTLPGLNTRPEDLFAVAVYPKKRSPTKTHSCVRVLTTAVFIRAGLTGKRGIKKEGEKDSHSNALYTNIGVMLDRSQEVRTDEAGPACLHSHYQRIQIEASGEMGRTNWGHFL